MKIKEAVEIKQLALDTGVVDDPDDFRVADQMSIEALKRCQYIAEHTDRWARVLLPGETEE